MKIYSAVLALLAISVTGLLDSAHAAVSGGSLDPAFGVGGKVSTDFQWSQRSLL